jgi:hypothetical protein
VKAKMEVPRTLVFHSNTEFLQQPRLYRPRSEGEKRKKEIKE